MFQFKIPLTKYTLHIHAWDADKHRSMIWMVTTPFHITHAEAIEQQVFYCPPVTAGWAYPMWFVEWLQCR